MIVPDSNLLLYAYNSDFPFQKKAADWLSDLLSGEESVGLCSVVLFNFIRISTNAKAFAKPLTIDEATKHVLSWLKIPSTEYISIEVDDLEKSFDLLIQASAGGNLTSDAQIAALSLKYKAIVHTADTDFVRFKKVKWFNPILDS